MKAIRVSFLQLFVVAFLFNLNFANAQILKWVSQIGGTSSDYGRELAIDSDGNIYIAGRTGGTMDADPGPGISEISRQGSNSAFFGKYDVDGNLVWVKQFETTNSITIHQIMLDNNEDLILTGNFLNTIDFDPGAGVANLVGNTGWYDVFFAKFDSDGNYIWAKSLGGPRSIENKCIDVDKDNNIILGGTFRDRMDPDPGTGHDTLYTLEWDNAYIAKYTPAGNYIWAFNMGGNEWAAGDAAYALVVDTNANIYTTGLYYGTADFDPGPGTVSKNHSTDGRVFFARYDADGNYQWVHTFNGDPISHMEIDREQNIYMASYFSGDFYPDFDPAGPKITSIESTDLYVAWYERSAGAYIGHIHLGGAGEDHIADMVLDLNDNIYITGYFGDSIGINGLYPENPRANGMDNIFMTKLKLSGETVWFANFETENFTAGDDQIREFFVDDNGFIYALGDFTDSLEFDPDTSSVLLHSEGGRDVFIAKYSQIPEFVIQPENTAGCEGDTISIISRVKGSANINFTWEQKDGSEWGPISWTFHGWSGEGDLFMDGVAYSENGNEYRAIATNEYSADTSETFILTVNQLPVINFGEDSSVCVGDTVTLDAGDGFSYLWDDASTDRFLEVTLTGEHFVEITDVHGCQNGDTIVVTVHENPTVGITANPAEVCPEQISNLHGNPQAAAGVGGDLVYQWTGDVAYISASDIADPAFSATDPVSYRLIFKASDINGCSDVDTIDLVVHPLPAQVDLGNDSIFCGEQTTVIRAGSGFHSYLWQDGSDGDTLFIDTTGTYSVRAFNEFGCETRDTVKIKLQYPYEDEEICLVTIELATGKNLVIWEKTPNVGTAFYNIYRESTIFGKYDLLGTVAYDDLSVFTDETANPENQQYLYKISAVDSCDLESELSPFHKSLFLQYVSSIDGVNLEWSEYKVEGGTMNFETYELYRGSDSTALSLLVEVSSSLDRYSDKDALALAQRNYYRIAGRMPDPCVPTFGGKKADAGPYSHSMSNLEDNRLQTGINGQDIVSNDLLIYPNPVSQSAMIRFPNPDQLEYNLVILDISGKVVYSLDNVTTDLVRISRGGLPAGIYFVELRGPDINRGKLVIE